MTTYISPMHLALWLYNDQRYFRGEWVNIFWLRVFISSTIIPQYSQDSMFIKTSTHIISMIVAAIQNPLAPK